MTNLRLLAIESAGTLCSATVCGFAADSFLSSSQGDKHTEVLLGLIRKALEQSGGSLQELDAIAYSAGPGAFTGLRVACGIAQGFGWALDKKLIPVGNLYALAYAHLKSLPNGAKILAATDARMHECYTAIYEKQGADLKEVQGPTLEKPESMDELLRSSGTQYVCGNAFRIYSPRLAAEIKCLSTDDANANLLVCPAINAYSAGQLIDPAKPVLHYVRNHVAQTIEERQQKKTN